MRPFVGVWPYLVSPIDDAGQVKEEVLRQLVDHLIRQGVHGLTPLGSTGEVPYLSWEQRRHLVRIVQEEARGRVPVVVGVHATTTAGAVEQARIFVEMGADGIVAMLATYFPLSDADLVGYFKAVANAVSCPVVLYSNPRFSGFDLSLPVLTQLADVPNIQYYKDATGNTGKLVTLANRLGDRLKLFSASAHVPLFVMMLGGVGWMAGPACLIPAQSVRLYELARARQWDEGLTLQKSLWEMNAAFQKYSLAACIKAGLELQGFAVGCPLPPQPALGAEDREDVRRVLQRVGTP